MTLSFQQKREKTAQKLGLKPDAIPVHIAIIMDGNGRWATERGLTRYHGHRQGGKTVESKMFDIPSEGRTVKIEFEIEAVDPGNIEYRISTPVLENLRFRRWRSARQNVKITAVIDLHDVVHIRHSPVRKRVSAV